MSSWKNKYYETRIFSPWLQGNILVRLVTPSPTLYNRRQVILSVALEAESNWDIHYSQERNDTVNKDSVPADCQYFTL